MPYQLSEKDLEFLTKMKQLMVSIKEYLDEMEQLEINNQKDGLEYQEQFNNYVGAMRAIKDLYFMYFINTIKCELLMKYIDEQRLQKPKDIKDNLDESQIWKAVYDYLDHSVAFRKKDVEVNTDTLAGFLVGRDYFYENHSLYRDFNHDYSLCFLSIVEEAIEQKKYQGFEKELIGEKYRMVFTNMDVAKTMETNHFVVGEVPSLTKWRKLIGLCGDDFNRFLHEHFEFYKKMLLEIRDYDYDDRDKDLISINIQCRLRATMLFIDKEVLDNIDTSAQLADYKDNSISKKALIEAVEWVKECHKTK